MLFSPSSCKELSWNNHLYKTSRFSSSLKIVERQVLDLRDKQQVFTQQHWYAFWQFFNQTIQTILKVPWVLIFSAWMPTLGFKCHVLPIKKHCTHNSRHTSLALSTNPKSPHFSISLYSKNTPATNESMPSWRFQGCALPTSTDDTQWELLLHLKVY